MNLARTFAKSLAFSAFKQPIIKPVSFSFGEGNLEAKRRK